MLVPFSLVAEPLFPFIIEDKNVDNSCNGPAMEVGPQDKDGELCPKDLHSITFSSYLASCRDDVVSPHPPPMVRSGGRESQSVWDLFLDF